MSKESLIKVFEGFNVRVVWDPEKEKYYFSVVDVVQVLTESPRPRKYWSALKAKLKEEGNEMSPKLGQLKLQSQDGKNRLTDVADLEQVLRIIQSIPSSKAEPFKQWLAEVGAQRVNQMIDPELTFQMAVDDYRRQGYSDRWINERMKSIKARKELTDEWERSGVHEKKDFAVLTNILTKAWSGMTTGQYKQYKGLKKESQKTAKTGGRIAKNAREDLEKEIGRSVISSSKASDYLVQTEDVETKEITE